MYTQKTKIKIYRQIAIILGICFLSDIIASLLPFNFPTNVTAMIVLMILLFTGIVKEHWIQEVGTTLVDNMPIMFIPSAVSLLISYKLILGHLISFIFICIISTLITWIVTYYTIALVIKIQNKILGRDNCVVKDGEINE